MNPMIYAGTQQAAKQLVEKVTLAKATCKEFEIPEDMLFAKTRKREVINARFAYYALLPEKSPSSVGRHYGQNHATILNARKKAGLYYETEKLYRERVDRLKKGIEDMIILIPAK